MNTIKSMLTGIICLFLFVGNVQASKQMSKYNTKQIQEMVKKEAVKQGLDPALALAIARTESDFNPDAVSSVGAIGVMQMMPATAWGEFQTPKWQLYDPQVNISLGVKFIKQLIDRYDGRVDIALSHYNGGSAVNQGKGRYRVIPATRKYVKLVKKRQVHYNKKLNKAYSEYAIANNTVTSNKEEQLARLRKLRMHNTLRGFNKNESSSVRKKMPNTKRIVSKSNSKRDKVKQWESIYK